MKKMKKFIGLAGLLSILMLSLVGCSTDAQETSISQDENTAETLVYEGSAQGYSGNIPVTVEVDANGSLKRIVIGDNEETPDIGTIAEEKIPAMVIEAQSLDVDSISGATVTSHAIIKAIANALESGGIDLAKFNYSPIEEKKEISYDLKPESMPIKKEITDSITLTDVKGRQVDIDLPISSYAISTMDVIEYIIPIKGEDAFSMLVGSGQDGGHGLNKYVELYIPLVGNYMEHTGQISDHNSPFDLEMILAMDPDVIIVNSAMAAHKYALEAEDQLRAAGIPIVLIDVPGKQLDTSVQQTMKILGQIFQEEEKAAEVSNFIDDQYKLIASKNLANKDNQAQVYYEKSGYSDIFGPTSTSKGGWGLVVDIAGGHNIADDLLLESASSKGASNTIDPEYVLNADPDYIIVSGINDGWLATLNKEKSCKFDILNRNGWNELKAIKNKNLYEFAHSTSRSIYAFYPSLKMAKIFYPEEFVDVNSEEILDEFFERFMLLDSDITDWFYSLEDCKK